MSSPTLLAGSRATTPLAVSQRPAMIFLSMAWPSANTRLAAPPPTAAVRKAGDGAERAPVDVFFQPGQVKVLEHAPTHGARRGGLAGRPVDGGLVRAGLGQGPQR